MTAIDPALDGTGRREGGRPATQVVLETEDVVVAYGGVQAVAGVSIDVRAGEVVGLIGPNGAGKSSFLAALGGQQRVASGHVRLDGHDVTRLPVHRRAALGIARTFQMTSEFGGMTVFENLMAAGVGVEGASLVNVVFRRGQQRELDRRVRGRVWEVLERFETTPIADLYGRELSGGQRRLVEIMRALMRSPKVLLLDEPMVGVAPHLVRRLVSDLKSLRDDGIALVIVEHALEVVQELCDHVNVMGLGRLIASGTYDEVVQDAAVQAAYLG